MSQYKWRTMYITIFILMLLIFAIEYLSIGSIYFFSEIIFFRRKPRTICLTFDDGPNPIYTKEIIDFLDSYQIRATFFVCGKEASENSELIKELVEKGHEIGNHGWNHLNMIFKSPITIRSEIEKTDKLLRNLDVKGQIHFRPPFTRMFLITPYIAMRMRKKIFLWNIPSKDYKAKNVTQIINKVMKKAIKGGIIVMHDGRADRSKSLEALKIIVPLLVEKHFKFETCSDYIKKT